MIKTVDEMLVMVRGNTPGKLMFPLCLVINMAKLEYIDKKRILNNRFSNMGFGIKRRINFKDRGKSWQPIARGIAVRKIE